MLETIKPELDLIINAVLATTHAESIYLFGSYAYGQPTVDSDLDVYVVVPDSDIDIVDLVSRIRLSLYKKKQMALDLLISKKSVFDSRKGGLYLESIVAKQGVKIYG